MKTPVLRALPPPPHDLLRHASLFLDLDGTLVEIEPRPDAVRVDARLRALLDCLKRMLDGRLVIISGRPAAELRSLLNTAAIAVAGSHGAEVQLPDGRAWQPPKVAQAPGLAGRLQALQALHPGVLIEQKPYSVALHYRLAPDAEGDCHRLAEQIAAAEGYVLQPGKKVIELKYHVICKGDAVRALMREAPLLGTGPVFIGDDQTDETGFDAANELGGAGILVGPPRASHASYRIGSVGAVLRWLEEASGCMA